MAKKTTQAGPTYEKVYAQNREFIAKDPAVIKAKKALKKVEAEAKKAGQAGPTKVKAAKYKVMDEVDKSYRRLQAIKAKKDKSYKNEIY